MNTTVKSIVFSFLAVLPLLGASTAALAESQLQHGKIRATVYAPWGCGRPEAGKLCTAQIVPLAKVKVTASRQGSGNARFLMQAATATTNRDGVAVLKLLPGRYLLRTCGTQPADTCEVVQMLVGVQAKKVSHLAMRTF